MRLLYKINENESIQYCDVMSLYPYICKYYQFPIGHPVIHLGDMCKKHTSMSTDGGSDEVHNRSPKELVSSSVAV